MKQDKEIIDAIEKCLEWYENNYDNTTIELLLNLQDKLALLSVNLAEIVAKSKGLAIRR